jgi:hypothetical protein
MAVIAQLNFQIVEEINYMFRPFSGWAIIRLKLEYRRKLIHYIVDCTSRMGELETRISQKTHTLHCGLHIKNGGP